MSEEQRENNPPVENDENPTIDDVDITDEDFDSDNEEEIEEEMEEGITDELDAPVEDFRGYQDEEYPEGTELLTCRIVEINKKSFKKDFPKGMDIREIMQRIGVEDINLMCVNGKQLDKRDINKRIVDPLTIYVASTKPKAS